MKKIKELVAVFPRVSDYQNILDTTAEKVFEIELCKDYLYSSNCEIRDYSEKKNVFFSNYSEFGKNEKYIINRIYSTSKIIFLVGGIGVGKSSFIKFFRNQLLLKNHICNNECESKSFGGLFCYIDFNIQPPISFSGNDTEKITYDLAWRMGEEIISQINEIYFDKKYEITTFWDEVIKSNYPSRIFSKIKNELLFKDVLDFKGTNYKLFFQKRAEIYSSLFDNNPINLLTYSNEICNYLTKTNKILNDCIFIVFDNLDICSAIVQNVAKDFITRYFNNISSKIIVCLRNSTYSTLYETAMAIDAATVVKHYGPDILSVIDDRLYKLIQKPDLYIIDQNIEKTIETFILNVKKIRDYINKNDTVKNFIRAICGNSIRKALFLARNLISNSIFDLFSVTTEINTSNIIRALMTGKNDSYEWSMQNQIDNIYHVDGYHDKGYFIKLRILRALKNKTHPDGIEFGKLIELLRGYNYSYDLILDAINEMLSEPKRLIWSNSLLHFKSLEELFQAKSSLFYISSAGIGYQSWLFKNIGYFQEASLDLYADSILIGTGWDYTKISNRIQLLFKFIRILVEIDLDEMNEFLTNHSIEKYHDVWLSHNLLSLEILDSVYNSFESISKHIKIGNEFSFLEFKDLQANIESDYYSIKNYANKQYKSLYS